MIMKNRITKVLLTAALIVFGVSTMHAQDNEWVNQIIICNGGRFEMTPPYIDYVTMEKYDPVTKAVTYFDTIYTQSVQDIVIQGNKAFVAAEDSIIEYNLDTYQRVVAVEDSGMSHLAIFDNKLIVTKQWPVARFYVEVLDISNNLGLLARVQNISGDCGGVAISDKDTVYVAVSGKYPTTRGKLAVIDPGTWTLLREQDFDTVAKGISDLYYYNGQVICVDQTPDGGENIGCITAYNPNSCTHVNHVMMVKVGKSIGTNQDLLYLKLNEGMGSYNLNTFAISDTTIIPDPGSAQHKYIITGAVDYINSELYINLGNLMSWGKGFVSSLTGDSITSFAEGISAEAMAIDFRTPVGIQPKEGVAFGVSVMPNPVSENMNVRISGKVENLTLSVYDMTGRTLFSEKIASGEVNHRINCSALSSGIYFLKAESDAGNSTVKFIRK
jgi:hypothetical protein